ncbi:MAG: glycosyltransferase family 4 protein [Bacteroidetes bacterium]|nr:glycosyltransferase family 4 protein [Bacteroidota bacterium]
MKSISDANKIIYIAPSLSSFVQNDIGFLSKKYNVLLNLYAWNKKYLTPLFLIHQLFYLLVNIMKVKVVIVSFGGYWSLLPSIIGRLFGVPVFIILNGTDCASIPMLHYGNLRSFPLRTFCNYSYKFAYKLLPVSSSLVNTRNKYHSDDKYSYQGYKHFFPKINTDYQVLFNGIDENFWKPIDNRTRNKKSFITVLSESQFILKGGPLILDLASRYNDYEFFFVGLNEPDSFDLPANVTFLGRLDPERLRDYFLSCQYYMQLSVYEGFGVALCEAMLCGCIPIGSSVNIIPEIIGSSGFILQKEDIDELVDLVEIALNTEDEKFLERMARDRIIENYSLKKREQKLISIIEQL